MNRSKITLSGINPGSLYKFLLISFLAVAIYTAGVSLAYAGPGGIASPMGSVLCVIVGFIYGNLGRALATLAIIIVGVGACMAKVSWGMAITIGIGISVIFNAQAIMSIMTGQVPSC